MYRQAWVTHTHGTIGQTSDDASVIDDTLLPQLRWLDAVLDEEPDGAWRVSWGGSAAFEDVETRDTPAADLLFGDFDGDGDSDALRVTGGASSGLERSGWRGGAHGFASWTTWATGSKAAGEAADYVVGDFDGNGRTDVLRTYSTGIMGGDYSDYEGEALEVSWSTLDLSRLRYLSTLGPQVTTTTTSSTVGGLHSPGPHTYGEFVSRYVVADIDGDGLSDVLTAR